MTDDNDDDHRTSTGLTMKNRFPSFLLPIVPERYPKAWIILNNIIAISGCLLLAEYWYANDFGTSTEERPFAIAFYLIWEFVICVVWVLESGLSASYQHVSLQQQSLQWYTKLELWIALFFTVMTAWMLCQWNLTEYHANDFWWIALDVSFYIYLAIRSCLYPGNTEQEQGNQDKSTLDDEDGSRSYQRLEMPNNNSQSGAIVV